MSAAASTRHVPHHRSGGVLAAWAAGATGIVAQMIFPFTDGGTPTLTILSVMLLATASLVHVTVTRGPVALLALVVVAGGGGLVAEAVGVHTGVPFGSYAYAGTLGPQVIGVPAVVPLAWLMMAYPALLVARRLIGRHRAAVPVVAAWALTSWDVFLDPQMVDAGHWRWAHPTPSLPGVDDIPLTNFAGWLVVSLVMCVLLDRLVGPPRRGPGDALPFTVFLWVYASSVLAHLAFFGRPPVALVGAIVMGVVAIPLAVDLWRHRRQR
ncbi:carotenoid biosynthesis protein [Aeromicrobium wangtongii]|uniref:Carotenoid biosynthesis protein n=1 Tax=Aeromicrobium wangtongii TaxID=2969247 RepID=A0ABY5MAS9_9ACTN|nr:carotenoid biosynthesis protein [Aeromicrobium wangtongii]MCD9196716.1 carotenoid biosynthesis protein [Aeromicrobium wangtongii]UUP14226.1 carotenoid biosynthesis protein [Aeromicrobium wangtongii]